MNLSRIMNPPDDGKDPRPAERQPVSKVSQPSTTPAETDKYSEEGKGNEQEYIPSVSFIVCMEAKEEGKVTYVSPTAYHLLGWDPDLVVGTPASLYCHPEDVADLYRAYQEMIDEDKAACLMYHRIPYKDPKKGYVLCSVTISRAGPHLIGACSLATEATREMHNAATASEVIIVTPSAARLAFTRWGPPSPSTDSSGSTDFSREASPQSPVESNPSPSPESSPKSEADELAQSFHRLTLHPPTKPEVAKRVALVVDRFSKDIPIIYCTNDEILFSKICVGRSFYDFVAPSDERRIRKSVDSVKAWGLNEQGAPADGGFAFQRFRMYLRGWDSSPRSEMNIARKRSSMHGLTPLMPSDSAGSTGKGGRTTKHRVAPERGVNVPIKETLLVDSIFSPQSDGIIVLLRPALTTA